MDIYATIQQKIAEERKQLAVLVDPDKFSTSSLECTIDISIRAEVDYFFVGGSLLTENKLSKCLEVIKSNSDIPAVLFPGDVMQIDSLADGILLLSLISGRNPDLLIGKHVVAAPHLRASKLDILPTGYMLVESGSQTTASYMSNALPIPNHNNEIAVCTAMAGEMLGLKLIYLDAGSGAQIPVSAEMIQAVKASIHVPLIVGGGIKSPEKAYENYKAGADLLVIGNAIEKSPELIHEIHGAVSSL